MLIGILMPALILTQPSNFYSNQLIMSYCYQSCSILNNIGVISAARPRANVLYRTRANIDEYRTRANVFITDQGQRF